MISENYFQITSNINYYEIILEEIKCDQRFLSFDNSYSRKQALKSVLDDIEKIQKLIKDLYFLRDLILKVEKSQQKIKRLCNKIICTN